MAKGWHRESRRHSLASKGIKTAQKIKHIPIVNKPKPLYERELNFYPFPQNEFERNMLNDYGKVIEDKPPKKALIKFKGNIYERKIQVSDEHGIYVKIDGFNVRVKD
jgi:hypothetical protein